jgi:hypothetical protein
MTGSLEDARLGKEGVESIDEKRSPPFERDWTLEEEKKAKLKQVDWPLVRFTV